MYTTLTPEIIKELNDLKDRSGVGAATLLKGKCDRPENINSTIISHWMTGRSKKARTEQLEYILDIWKKEDPIIAISDDVIDLLESERERTQVQGERLYRLIGSTSKELRLTTINLVFTRRIQKIRKTSLDVIVKTYASIPDAVKTVPVEIAPKKNMIKLTDQVLHELKNHKQRTGLGPVKFMKSVKNPPEGLSHQTIGNWFSKNSTTAEKKHVDFVLKNYRKL